MGAALDMDRQTPGSCNLTRRKAKPLTGSCETEQQRQETLASLTLSQLEQPEGDKANLSAKLCEETWKKQYPGRSAFKGNNHTKEQGNLLLNPEFLYPYLTTRLQSSLLHDKLRGFEPP